MQVQLNATTLMVQRALTRRHTMKITAVYVNGLLLDADEWTSAPHGFTILPSAWHRLLRENDAPVLTCDADIIYEPFSVFFSRDQES
jgi:hypothetical protein